MERSIEVTTRIAADPLLARQVLLEEPRTLFAGFHLIEDGGAPRFDVDLSVDLGGGASAHQAVALQPGMPQATEAGIELPVEWHAIGREQLFPRFLGRLVLAEVAAGAVLQL